MNMTPRIRLVLAITLVVIGLTLVGCASSQQSAAPTAVSTSPAQPQSPADTSAESLEATRARCAREPLEQGRILFTGAFTDTDQQLKYDLFYLNLQTRALRRALDFPTPDRLPAAGNTAQGLLIPGRVGGSLSPDGKRIAYFDMTGVIVADADGSNPQTIDTSLLRLSDNIQWSPDGARIAYVDFVSGTARIAEVRPPFQVLDVQPDIRILNISSLSFPGPPLQTRWLYSAGCTFLSSQCPWRTNAYLARSGEGYVPPKLVGSNATMPRQSPVSGLIAALWVSGDPPYLRPGVIESPGDQPWTPAEALVSAGLSWSPNGCALVSQTLDQRDLFLFDLARATVTFVDVPDTLQSLHPQWVR
ncbi:TolB family protein [Candidatus Roseilinea sp. NK_OTU-006]|jgi:hypothetical protein|uniref:TolB family protein n=1 Tax=Candidatus Roseilinea sp. NK_OTU-006 TaxID=2704250 RepID=UPI00145C5AE1|nr:hypothetical protein [Candidatus Roseilinea sp. NK_OTU-006]